MQVKGMNRRDFALACLATVALPCSIAAVAAETSQNRAALYFGGDILTMEGGSPQYAEALVVKAGKIAFVGSRTEAQRRFRRSKAIDLKGKTLLPGFIDGHGHVYSTGFFSLMANLHSQPDGPGNSFDRLVETTREWMAGHDGRLVIGKLGWIVGSGYDDSRLAEQKHPSAQILDRISTDLPVILFHQSGHLATVNSKALELAGITAATPDPVGGAIRRDAAGNPTGVLEEAALFKLAFPILARVDAELQDRSLAEGQERYARWGYTTAQDGRSTPDVTAALTRASRNGGLYLDIVSYPDIEANRAAVEVAFARGKPGYVGHYRIAGAKLTLDGSPQGKSAWLNHPYLVPPEGKGADYSGYPAMPDEKAVELVSLAFRNHWQLLVHANGDAAIDQLIRAVGTSLNDFGYKDHRTVLVHGQTLRKDQIGYLKQYGMLPSLFPAQTFYWGDWHKNSVFGSPRADYISPTRDVLDAGMTLTSHHDAPVIAPSSMRVLDATVNRTTRSGRILGADQRLTAYEGLKALTIWAAIQHYEENSKGTLTVGKIADLVVLESNPLKVAPATIHTIRVVETVKDGKTVWRRDRPDPARIGTFR